MFNILVWCVYGIFVGSIAKSIVPGEENFNLVKTIALGVAGSYAGGAVLYMVGSYSRHIYGHSRCCINSGIVQQASE